MNETGVSRTNRHDRSIPELPSLESGIQLLRTDGDARGPLHVLVADHLLLAGGTARWIDAGGHATTRPIAQLAPELRLLERVHVARGFTAFQHHALCERAADVVDGTTSLVVCPALDARYRSDDLPRERRTDLLASTIATVAGIARTHDVPVLVTTVRDDSFAEPVENAARTVLECESTRFGPRFVGEDFETLVYPVGNGHLQTTLAFWSRVLEARTPLYDSVGTEYSAGTESVPTPDSPRGVTVDGTH